MSQGQQPAGFGKCNVCKQLQPYTSQVCDICQSKLPWAVQVTPVMPAIPEAPQVPVRSQAAPAIEPKDPWKVVRTVVGFIVGAIVLSNVAVFLFLTVAGNSLRNTFGDATTPSSTGQPVASNAVVAPNAALAPQAPSADCGRLSAAECEWERGLEAAGQPVDFEPLRGESDSQYLDRLSRQAFQVRVNIHALPPTPPRYNEAFTMTLRALDEWDKGNQLLKNALETNSAELAQQADTLYKSAGNTLLEVSNKMEAIRSTPG